MRSTLRAFSRFRPRFLTLLVFCTCAAMITLANLSPGLSAYHADSFAETRYGWPKLWHRYVTYGGMGAITGFVRWEYHFASLLKNLAVWLVVLATVAGACEWLLRRYRPRPRWSMRTLLIGVGLLAVICGWCAALRRRAEMQAIPVLGTVWVERWGPKWLDILGLDRYRRRVVGADFGQPFTGQYYRAGDRADEDVLRRIVSLPKLQFLLLHADQLTVATSKTIREARQLRALGIDVRRHTGEMNDALAVLAEMDCLRALTISLDSRDEGLPRECLAAVGNLRQLGKLRLESVVISGESLRSLEGLTQLRALSLEGVRLAAGEGSPDQPLLANLPVFARLEVLSLVDLDIRDEDLRYLAALPRLQSLTLVDTRVTVAGLATLANLDCLDELAIAKGVLSAAELNSLAALRRLKRLHLVTSVSRGLMLDHGEVDVPPDEVDECRKALKTLRQKMPELTIDDDWENDHWTMGEAAVDSYEDMHRPDRPAWPPPTDWLSPSEKAQINADATILAW